MEHESDFYIKCNWCSWYSYQRINKVTGGLGNNRTSGDHPNYSITEISQNTEKSPGDLRSHSNSRETPLANADMKNFKRVTIIVIRNLTKKINPLAVPLIRYIRPSLKWRKEELRQMGKKTRKLMTMHKALHLRDDIDRLHV